MQERLVTDASEETLSIGKAPPELLAAALEGLESGSVVQGPGVGRDAAIVDWTGADEGQMLVVTSDPITFVDADAGRLAVTVNANDVFAVGGEPRWLMSTILAPPVTTATALSHLIADLRAACVDAGVDLIGGHSEVTDAVSRVVVSCTMIGTVERSAMIRSDGAEDGDVIVQAGRAAVEGTAILGYPHLLEAPGISVAAAARALRDVDGVHAMHDVTEGGMGTAALELAEAAGLAPELEGDDALWLPETLALCESRGLDAFGLLGSGTLLAAVSPEAVGEALAALDRAAVEAAAIGRVRRGIRATLNFGGQRRPLSHVVRDEALRALADAE